MPIRWKPISRTDQPDHQHPGENGVFMDRSERVMRFSLWNGDVAVATCIDVGEDGLQTGHFHLQTGLLEAFQAVRTSRLFTKPRRNPVWLWRSASERTEPSPHGDFFQRVFSVRKPFQLKGGLPLAIRKRPEHTALSRRRPHCGAPFQAPP